MKKVNLKKLAILGLTSGIALTAQGVFAETNSANGTVLAAGCAKCGGFGASTKANHQKDLDDTDEGDLADNAGMNATSTPVRPIAPAPQTNPSSNVNSQNRFDTNSHLNNNDGQFNSNQSNPTSNGQRRLDDQGMQRRIPVDSR